MPSSHIAVHDVNNARHNCNNNGAIELQNAPPQDSTKQPIILRNWRFLRRNLFNWDFWNDSWRSVFMSTLTTGRSICAMSTFSVSFQEWGSHPVKIDDDFKGLRSCMDEWKGLWMHTSSSRSTNTVDIIWSKCINYGQCHSDIIIFKPVVIQSPTKIYPSDSLKAVPQSECLQVNIVLRWWQKYGLFT